MTRRIYCEQCGGMEKQGPMHPEDVLAGWNRRRVEIRAKKPAEHQVKIYSGASIDTLEHVQTNNLASLMCDACGEPILDGKPAWAVTMWRGDEPGNWEKDYE